MSFIAEYALSCLWVPYTTLYLTFSDRMCMRWRLESWRSLRPRDWASGCLWTHSATCLLLGAITSKATDHCVMACRQSALFSQMPSAGCVRAKAFSVHLIKFLSPRLRDTPAAEGTRAQTRSRELTRVRASGDVKPVCDPANLGPRCGE